MSNVDQMPDAHQQALEALVELADGAMRQLRNGLNVIRIDVVAGTQLVRDNADLLSRAISQIGPKLSVLPSEAVKSDRPLIDIDTVAEAVAKLDAALRSELCPECGLLKD